MTRTDVIKKHNYKNNSRYRIQKTAAPSSCGLIPALNAASARTHETGRMHNSVSANVPNLCSCLPPIKFASWHVDSFSRLPLN